MGHSEFSRVENWWCGTNKYTVVSQYFHGDIVLIQGYQVPRKVQTQFCLRARIMKSVDFSVPYKFLLSGRSGAALAEFGENRNTYRDTK